MKPGVQACRARYRVVFLAVLMLTRYWIARVRATPVNAERVRSPQVDSAQVVALQAWRVHPWAIPADGYTQTVITATLSDPLSEVQSVSVDLSALGGSAQALMFDDGVHNDGAASDGTFGLLTVASSSAQGGETPLQLTVSLSGGQQTVYDLGTFLVLTPLDTAWPDTLVPFLGWGTGEDDWQISTGLPWNYAARFLTWDWQTWNPDFVRGFCQSAWSNGSVPVLTVEMILAGGSCAGLTDRDCVYAHLQDATLMGGYFDRLGEAAQQAAGSEPVIFHIEPDASAYMQRYSIDHNGEGGIVADEPDTIPAWTGAGYPDTYAGAVQRMVDSIHTQAPNALVALHGRLWATGMDVGGNTNPDLDVDGIAQRSAHFLTAAGGPELDLIVVDWKTVDAGSGGSPWWDDTNQTLPHFNRVIYWENRVAFYSGLPLVLWRVPVGNMDLPADQQDNRVDYAFAHARDLVGAGIVAVVLGGGANQTNPSTDGGNVQAKATVYYDPPAAPVGLAVSPLGTPALVEASWSPNTELDLWGYRLYFGRGSDALDQSLDARRQTTIQTVLPGGGQWWLSVVAYDARGVESEMSSPVSVVVAAPYRVFLPFIHR